MNCGFVPRRRAALKDGHRSMAYNNRESSRPVGASKKNRVVRPVFVLQGVSMNANTAIQTALRSTQHVLTMYLSDLSDADLVVRPVPTANHIAWQLGHVISSEGSLGGLIPGAKFPELPAGFADQHGPKTAGIDPPKGFGTKKDYFDLFGKVREATIVLTGKLSEADLDKPNTGKVAEFAPTIGALLILVANHTMMHAGQFTVVRRKLGKPVLF